MSQWHEHRKDHGNHLWLYSERGWMSYLFWHVLADKLDFVLDKAKDVDGVSRGEVIRPFESHTTLTEYELGPQGFGSPDGSFMTTAPGRRCFVFVEAKHGCFANSYRIPNPKTIEEFSEPDLDIGRLCEANKFNSSINGQLELRWRFVNALRASATKDERIVSERHMTVLPPDLMVGDRFYWRLRLRPDSEAHGDWRRVDMRTELGCLYQRLVEIDDFYLLSITFDGTVPDFRDKIRLYDPEGNRLDPGRRVFWLDRRLIEDTLSPI